MHVYHPKATGLGYLSPGCEDCTHKVLGYLDDEHFERIAGISRQTLIEALPRQLVAPLLGLNAWHVQVEAIAILPLADRIAIYAELDADAKVAL